ncbi:MAG: hypothetical protein OXE85_01465 [Roseovarius sp.]|nr:hypothetical protein [Roseovarius sp.]
MSALFEVFPRRYLALQVLRLNVVERAAIAELEKCPERLHAVQVLGNAVIDGSVDIQPCARHSGVAHETTQHRSVRPADHSRLPAISRLESFSPLCVAHVLPLAAKIALVNLGLAEHAALWFRPVTALETRSPDRKTLLIRSQAASMTALRGLLNEEASCRALDDQLKKSLSFAKAAEERLRESCRRRRGRWTKGVGCDAKPSHATDVKFVKSKRGTANSLTMQRYDENWFPGAHLSSELAATRKIG